MSGRARATLRGAESRWFSRDAVRAVDREAMERYGLPGVALMENAASGILAVALDMLDGSNGPVLLLCGPGNNGGDGFALARRLHNAGVKTVTLLFRSPEAYTGDAATNLRVLEAMDLERRVIESDRPAAALEEAAGAPALIVDALLGTGLTDSPRGGIGGACAWLRSAPAPVLAVDIPSGLDCDAGEPFDASRCARATVTATMAGLKLGFRNERSRDWTGRLEVVDIGAPLACLDALATERG
ncbi:MAG: NAD(P)H-hydrate epimerase [Phycisphaerales bacterium]